MIAGSMLALTFTSKHSDTIEIKEIKHRLLSKSSICTLVANFALMAIFYILSFRIVVDIKRISEFLTEFEASECIMKIDAKIRSSSDSTTASDVDYEKERAQRLKQAKEECMVHNPKWLKL